MNSFARLCRSELHRLRARRLTHVLALVYIVFIVVVMFVAFGQHSKDPNAGQAAAAREQARLVQHCLEMRKAPTDSSQPDTRSQGLTCENITVEVDDKRWGVTDTIDAVKGFIVVGALLGFVLGASAGGAEWAAGTLQALLFWEPRRVRVLGAKALTLVGVVTAFGVIGQLLTIAGSWFLTTSRGTTAGYTADAWRTIVGTQGRGIALLVIAALAAFSISSLTRHTTAALGAAFAYLVIAEPLLLWWEPWLIRYLFGANVGALIDGRLTDADTSRVITAGPAGIVLSLYALGLLAIAMTLFVRRDVT